MNKRKYTCYLPRASSLLPHPGAYQSDDAAAAAAALVVVVYKRISFAVSFFSFLLYTFIYEVGFTKKFQKKYGAISDASNALTFIQYAYSSPRTLLFRAIKKNL